MRLLITILLFSNTAFATDYYVKNAGGSGTGTSDPAAWSPSYFASHKNVVAGDRVFFRAGEVFNMALPVTDNSGTSGSQITYGSYGTGSRPVFNTLTTLTTWSLLSGNIYYTTVDVPRLQIVTVDGVLKGMGRYPKTGYLPIQSHSGLTSVTSTSIGAIPFDPAGAEFVTRKARYIIDRHNITSRSGNTLNITSPSDFGPTGNYGLSDGNGFFIQGSLGTLTQAGDWYYDKAAKRLYVHFGSGNSSSHVIQASLVDDAVSVQARNYINFNNLEFIGGNSTCLNAWYCGNINVTNCTFRMSTEGMFGLQGNGHVTLDGVYMENMLSTGVNSVEANYLTIRNSYFRDIHTIPGMGRSGDMIGSGLGVTGDNITIQNNTVKNTGYCGISSYATAGGGNSYLLIENNIIDSFSTNKDDAGGIYTYGHHVQTFANRIIRNNLVKNGLGNIDGVSIGFSGLPFAVGIYLDNYSSQVNVYNNLVYNNSGSGMFMNSTNTDTIANNTFHNNGFEAFLLLSYGTSRGDNQTVHDLYVHHNQLIAGTFDQILMVYEMYDNPSILSSIGTFNNNTFYRPFGTTSYIRVDNRSTGGQVVTDYALPGWLSTYSKEQSSINSTVAVSDASKFRVEYNPTVANTTVNLNANYRDVLNTAYSGTMPLNPYSGRVLMYESALAVPLNNWTEIKFRKVQIYP